MMLCYNNDNNNNDNHYYNFNANKNCYYCFSPGLAWTEPPYILTTKSILINSWLTADPQHSHTELSWVPVTAQYQFHPGSTTEWVVAAAPKEHSQSSQG